MKLTSNKISIDGKEVHYLEGGRGPAVLLLHGWGSSAEKYRESFASLPEESMSVLIPDLPGFGLTPLYSEDWDLSDYADWTRDFASAKKIEHCVAAGHSFGGRVTILLAAEGASFIKGIILYAAAGVTARPTTKITFWRKLAKAGKSLFSLPVLSALYEPARRVLYRITGASDYRKAGNKKQIMQKVIARDLTPFLPDIKLPTEIIWGEKDKSTPLEDARKLQQQIPQSSLKVIPDAGHAIHLENPERFAQALRDSVHNLTES